MEKSPQTPPWLRAPTSEGGKTPRPVEKSPQTPPWLRVWHFAELASPEDFRTDLDRVFEHAGSKG